MKQRTFTKNSWRVDFFFYARARRYRLWGYNKLNLKKEGVFFPSKRPQLYYDVGLMREAPLFSRFSFTSVIKYSLAVCARSKKRQDFLDKRKHIFISCSSLALLVFFFNLNFGFYKGLFCYGFYISFERLIFSKILKFLYKKFSFKRLGRRFFFNFCIRRLRTRLASCGSALTPKKANKKGLFLLNNIPRGAYFF